ncbi:3-oxoacyl-[acyl-carrier-protein] reductase [Pseudaquidulcibacter saccharophilus]|uniref:3-oxoacyl-[acyl-carrier-protein] reductase n=1 Tax=Pseudaquidulcibacter saccharophilus TaxID=2831900 RepID=UPI001EFF49DB|nr:3-oxoacyl-[acyl-carrier-protein] reductase [Pseudaquidulcibacter saccharophilus]
MFDLTGKKALVTGATGGLGSAIAKALAAQGAIVAISGTREAVLNELAAQIPNSVPLVANLSGEGEAEGLIKRAEEALGGLDILVANAGVTRDGLLMRMKDSDFDDVLKINLYSYFAMCKAAMRGMMKQKSGRIIGIASIVGVTGNAGQANYAASKAGMIGFTKSVAQEVASRGITANCIAPGFIVSPMTEILTDAQKAATMAQIPAGRMGEADEIAALACYLASDEAAYITGQTININGGMAMI